jgi:hypothetical protein
MDADAAPDSALTMTAARRRGGVSTGAFGVAPNPAGGLACPGSGFWAPALKNIDGAWYIFVTGHENVPDARGERNLVLSSSSDDPMDVGAWAYRGALDHEPPGLDGEPIVLAEVDDALTVRATVRENGKRVTGSLYFAYSHNDGALFGSQVRVGVGGRAGDLGSGAFVFNFTARRALF